MQREKLSEKAAWQDLKKVQRIRARPSYHLFKGLYDFLKTNPSTADILRKFYEILDKRHTFGSMTHAVYAAESLELVLKDYGEVKHAWRRIQRR